MDTKYTKAFENLRKNGEGLYNLRGASVLVEILEEEEVTTSKDSSIVIVQDTNQVRGGMSEFKGLVGIVLLTGEGYYDSDNNKYVPLDVEPGNIVLLPKYSVSYYSVFPGIVGYTHNALGLVSDNEIKFTYKDIESYQKAKELLND